MQIDLEQFRKPCSCGHVHEISVQGIWIEEGAVKRLYQMLTEEEELGEFIAPVIVWDDNTKEAAEEALEVWKISAWKVKISMPIIRVLRFWKRIFRKRQI